MRTVTYAQALREAMAEEMERDPSVFLLGEDIGEPGGVFGVTSGLAKQFGDERVLDTPISEQGIVGAAVGASLLGGRPVVEIMFGDFVTLAMDMIVNQAAKTQYMTGGRISAPVTVRMVTGTAGSTSAQHSQSLEAWFVHTPGLKVIAPSNPSDAKGLLKAAIRDPDPTIIFEHKLLYNSKGEIPDDSEPAKIGEGRVLRAGTDLTLVAYLHTARLALDAADDLAEDGISVEVFDPRTLVPFDRAGMRASLERTGRLMVAHEAPERGGVGAEIAAIASTEMWDLLDGPIGRVCGRNTPVPYAPELEADVIPGVDRIATAVRALLD